MNTLNQRVVLTVEVVNAVVSLMKPRGSFAYYRGYIAQDRSLLPGAENHARARKVGLLADEMMKHGCPPRWAYGEGTVVDGYGTGTLTQQRLGENDYRYIFTKH